MSSDAALTAASNEPMDFTSNWGDKPVPNGGARRAPRMYSQALSLSLCLPLPLSLSLSLSLPLSLKLHGMGSGELPCILTSESSERTILWEQTPPR